MTLKELKQLAKDQNIDISELDKEHVYFVQFEKYDTELVNRVGKIFQTLGIKCIMAPPGIKIYKLDPSKNNK